jgi:hypothetical protein
MTSWGTSFALRDRFPGGFNHPDENVLMIQGYIRRAGGASRMSGQTHLIFFALWSISYVLPNVSDHSVF